VEVPENSVVWFPQKVAVPEQFPPYDLLDLHTLLIILMVSEYAWFLYLRSISLKLFIFFIVTLFCFLLGSDLTSHKETRLKPSLVNLVAYFSDLVVVSSLVNLQAFEITKYLQTSIGSIYLWFRFKLVLKLFLGCRKYIMCYTLILSSFQCWYW